MPDEHHQTDIPSPVEPGTVIPDAGASASSEGAEASGAPHTTDIPQGRVRGEEPEREAAEEHKGATVVDEHDDTAPHRDEGPEHQEVQDTEREPKVNLADAFSDLKEQNPEAAHQFQQMAAEQTPAQLAQSMKQFSVPEDQALSFLKNLYPDKSDQELMEALHPEPQEGHGVEPAPDAAASEEEPPVEPIKSHKEVEDIEKEFGPLREEIMEMPEGTEEEKSAKEEAKSLFRERFKEKAMKIAATGTKSGFITMGIILLLFFYLMSWHTGKAGGGH